MSNNKFILTLIVIVFSASGILAFRLVSDSNIDTSTKTGAVLDKFDGTSEASADTISRLAQISSLKTSSFHQGDKSGSILFFDNETGRIMETEITQNKESQLTPSKTGYVSSIWSEDGKKVAILSNDRNGTRWSIYDMVLQKSSDLPSDIQAVAFSPQGNQIAYFQAGEKDSGIYIAQPDGTIPKKIFNTRSGAIELYWPESSYVYALAREPRSEYASLLRISMDGQINRVVTERRNLRVSWSGDGKKALVSSSTSVGLPELFYLDTQNETLSPVALTTFASKCTWSIGSQSAICAVPTEKITSEKLIVPDDIVQIDLPGMKQTVIYTRMPKDAQISVSRPQILGMEGYLVFINSLDGHLYSIEL